MTIELRPYQAESVDSLFAYFAKNTGNPIVCLPTGSGKSLVLAAFIRQACETVPGTRILVATHRAELITQDADAIRAFWPACDVGIYSAGLASRQLRTITVGGVQSLVACKDLPRFDLLLVDEAHLCPHSGDGMYRSLISTLQEKNPKLKIVGLTATPYRLNGGKLTRGKGKIFSSICYELPVQRLVDEGWLSALVSPDTSTSFSTSGVTTSAGDFAKGELASKIEAQDDITRAALEEASRLAHDRKSWLVYCVSVEHARQASQHLFAMGIPSAVVTGEDDMGARKQKIEAFKRGEIRALVSVDILTVGFDVPRVDCIVLLRPTQSTGLYVQIVGRGMRLFPGKRNCIVLDYGSNIATHGPITNIRPKTQAKSEDDPKIKECPKCAFELPTWRKECPECGHEFPPVPREIEHEKRAARVAIMGPAPEPEWITLEGGFSLDRWTKKVAEGEPPATPTVVVKYHTGNMVKSDYREWVCPEHSGFAFGKFEKWWRARGGLMPIPRSVDDTIARASELRPVDAIVVEKDGKYDRVAQVRFGPVREPGSDDDQGSEGSSTGDWVDEGPLPF